MSTPDAPAAKSSRRTAQAAAAIIEDMARGDQSPLQIAQRHGMSLAQLIRWASTPTTAQQLARVRRLADERAALAVSSARVAAAHALRELALDTEHPETARRACVDLLKLDTRPVDHEAPASEAPPDISAESRDAIRALLEHLESHADSAPSPDIQHHTESDA